MDRWFFTELGTSSLKSFMVARSPEPLFQLRSHLALEDRTICELMQTMAEEMFFLQIWLPISRRKKVEELTYDPYRPGSEKNYYATTLPSAAYMITLLRSDRLFEQGCKEVKHAASDEYYKLLLKGDFAKANSVFEDGPLELDVVETSAPIPLEDGEALTDTLDFDLEAEAELLYDNMLADLEVEEVAPDSSIDSDRMTEPVSCEDPWMEYLGRGNCFGVFRFTRKPKAGRFGSIQAECPFHKLSKKSKCRRTVLLNGPTPQDQFDVLKSLMWWCTMASSFDRQREHIVEPIFSVLSPRLSELLDKKIIDRPVDVKDDHTLDMEAASIHDGGAEQGRSRGKGKGRGKTVKRKRSQASSSAQPAHVMPPASQIEPQSSGTSSSSSSSSD